jgi:Na+-transporting methylmalonyl-CoA/oxaloacetate decarboxylase gamma subunit
MPAHTFLALAEKPATSVLDALPHLAGMLMVMVTLFLMWGVCALTARLIQLVAPEPAAPPVPIPVASTDSPATAAELATPPEIIAVIAAAVASVTGPSHRIISIRRQSTTWEKAGRQSILTSHRIR